ncbi:fructosamine kinase family protein [Ulvibacterium marinum]|uniref:fructosamine kinase family protein n=1 Tax=Ulvibacterium marinum TaxID=2419782 RepID=UPI002494CB98|nr:fructosamine kinase family protein [Ulvibacterium marinum]
MQKELKAHIEYLLCINIQKVQSLSGGDISQAYLLETETEHFFCKVNRDGNAHKMFLVEKAGLEAISNTQVIATPNVLLCEPLEKGAFLIMEYIKPGRASQAEMAQLGHQLAALHQFSKSDYYGWETDNFIGSLPQGNSPNTDWGPFYVQERLLPQIKTAIDNKQLDISDIPSETKLSVTCKNLFPKTEPALLHGDLWGGNYLVSQGGKPYLIDPAIYYGHHEVDIAMTRLFGGFDSSFYHAYQEHFPKEPFEDERRDIYQLYYLLVHLNLFGRSYYGSVKAILKRYF